MVGAHVTLVFGVTSVSAAALTDLARAIAKDQPPFEFAIDGQEVEAHEMGEHNLLLTVGQGRDAFVAMHEAFYAGVLAGERRSDVAFSPHITIATNPRLDAVINAAPEAKPLTAIRARIDAIDVVRLSGQILEPIVSIPLTGSRGPSS